MIVSTLEFPKDAIHWHLVKEYLELRKSVFVDRMSWDLYHDDNMEFEQYDTIFSVYVIAHHDGKVLGGARLVRTDREFGTGKVRYSYMIRDAYLGLLEGLPQEICSEKPPVDKDVWELTRFAVFESGEVGKNILLESNRYLRELGAQSCLFLGPPAFLRIAKSMNFSPVKLGAITGNHDGRFLAFSCSIID